MKNIKVENLKYGDVLKPTEAAEIAGVSVQTVYNWIKAGKIETLPTAGTAIYRPDFEQYVKVRNAYFGGAVTHDG